MFEKKKSLEKNSWLKNLYLHTLSLPQEKKKYKSGVIEISNKLGCLGEKSSWFSRGCFQPKKRGKQFCLKTQIPKRADLHLRWAEIAWRWHDRRHDKSCNTWLFKAMPMLTTANRCSARDYYQKTKMISQVLPQKLSL